MDAHDQKTQQQESRATADRRGSISLSEQEGSKCTNQSCWITTNHSRASCFIRSRITSRPHRLKKTSGMQSKRCDLLYTWLNRETNEKLSFYCDSPRWITTTFSSKLKGRVLQTHHKASPLNSEIFGWFFSQQDVVVPRFFIDLWHKGVFINKTRHVNQLIQGERRLSHLKIKESCVNA